MSSRIAIPAPQPDACLVVMDAAARSALCKYSLRRDCLNDLTPGEIQTVFGEVFRQPWRTNPSLFEWVVVDKRFYVLWGVHSAVVQFLRHTLNTRGHRNTPFFTPSVTSDSVNLYVVGAERLR